MALFRKFFYRKPPDGLLEITERVYVFDYCFTTDAFKGDNYKVYIGGIIGQLHDHFPDGSYMVFDFREGDQQSQIASVLSEYDMTVINYPRHYEGCPLLSMETIHHFLRSSESWLHLGPQNILLMHCETGGWPVLAFMLAALLIYRKQYTGEQKTLDMIYKQAPRELLHLMSPLNPLPSQLRYLQYITRRNVGSEWPPLDRGLTLDCVIIRLIPNMDGEGGCRPIFRIHGLDPLVAANRTPKVLFSTPKRSKLVRYYKQTDCELVKIDIHCHVQGDVVLECISLDSDLEQEQMMFRIMFNTAFIRSNILMHNRDEIDISWNDKDRFPKDFRVEVLFSDMDAASSAISIELPHIEEKGGLPVEAFAKVQEIFSHVDWLDSKTEVVNVLQQITASNILERLDSGGVSAAASNLLKESLSGKLKLEPRSPLEEGIKSPTSRDQEQLPISTIEESVDASQEMKIETLESESSAENKIKSPQSTDQGRQLIPSFGQSADSNSIEKKIESLESKLLENDIERHISMPQGKESLSLIEPSMDANLIEKQIDLLESKTLSENDDKSLASTAQKKQKNSLSEQLNDKKSIQKKIEPQALQVSLQLPTQSKIISQRVHQASRSGPISYCSSLQGSPLSVSKYHSAPSTLGITALLQDHVAIETKEEEVTCATVSPSSSTLSPSLLNMEDHAVMDNKEEVNCAVTVSPSPTLFLSIAKVQDHAAIDTKKEVTPAVTKSPSILSPSVSKVQDHDPVGGVKEATHAVTVSAPPSTSSPSVSKVQDHMAVDLKEGVTDEMTISLPSISILQDHVAVDTKKEVPHAVTMSPPSTLSPSVSKDNASMDTKKEVTHAVIVSPSVSKVHDHATLDITKEDTDAIIKSLPCPVSNMQDHAAIDTKTEVLDGVTFSPSVSMVQDHATLNIMKKDTNAATASPSTLPPSVSMVQDLAAMDTKKEVIHALIVSPSVSEVQDCATLDIKKEDTKAVTESPSTLSCPISNMQDHATMDTKKEVLHAVALSPSVSMVQDHATLDIKKEDTNSVTVSPSTLPPLVSTVQDDATLDTKTEDTHAAIVSPTLPPSVLTVQDLAAKDTKKEILHAVTLSQPSSILSPPVSNVQYHGAMQIRKEDTNAVTESPTLSCPISNATMDTDKEVLHAVTLSPSVSMVQDHATLDIKKEDSNAATVSSSTLPLSIATLQDHAAMDTKKEVIHAVTVSPPSSILSPSVSQGQDHVAMGTEKQVAYAVTVSLPSTLPSSVSKLQDHVVMDNKKEVPHMMTVSPPCTLSPSISKVQDHEEMDTKNRVTSAAIVSHPSSTLYPSVLDVMDHLAMGTKEEITHEVTMSPSILKVQDHMAMYMEKQVTHAGTMSPPSTWSPLVSKVQDHAAMDTNKDVTPAVTVSPSASKVPKSVEPSSTYVPLASSPALIPPLSLKSSGDDSTNVEKTGSLVAPTSAAVLPLPPPPPPLPSSFHEAIKSSFPSTPPPYPPPSLTSNSSVSASPLLPSSFPGISPCSTIESSIKTPPPPPLPPSSTGQTSISAAPSPPPPPPPPGHSGIASAPASTSSVPLPPDPSNTAPVPPVPPPPSVNGFPKAGSVGNGNVPPVPGPPSAPGPPSVPGPPSGVPFGAKGRGLLRAGSKGQLQSRRSNLKPYHWLKLTRAMQGSLWAETQKPEEASKAPEFDMSELESLFSAATPNSDHGSKGKSSRGASGPKNDKVQLIELRRAYNCEIMLSKVKIPLPDLMCSVLALDDSALDIDQVENLIKFSPTKEEMELLKGYNGDKENLGKCEQFFLELMNLPRVENKLRVFSFKIQFRSQASELRRDLNIVNSASEEIRNSVKLKRIMQTILSLGNALNHGTARGSAIGFRLDSLLKLTDTRARNNKMTLMHYLCKVLAEKLPELLDFPKDLVNLESATKIQLKYLAEEMQAISKGLEKVVQELTASENDGFVSENFCKILKEFLCDGEAEVRSLAQLYSNVGRNADALALYFGEDPARCPFEQVVSTLFNFVRMFVRAQEENRKQLEFERKKAEKEAAENEKLKLATNKESEHKIRSPVKNGNIK